MHRQPGDRTGFCQPDLDRIPHSGCGTVRDQGAGRLIDLLQIVVSIVFTRFMALFQHTITCQSVLLTKREMAHCGGWTAFVRSFPAISPAFLSVQKEQRFFCRMAKTLLFFKCCFCAGSYSSILPNMSKSSPSWMRAVRAGACGRALGSRGALANSRSGTLDGRP